MKRALLLGLASSAALGQAQPDPREWLDRMSMAVEQLNYIGTFVHIVGEETETMRVIHRVQDGSVRERLVSLGGTGLEVVRTDDETHCIMQAERAVLVDKARRPAIPLQANLPKYSAELERYYAFLDHGTDRIADREARVVEVRPLDDYRYGYRLWLDADTAMPLKSVRVTARGESVEQVLFTEISFPERIDDAALEPSIASEGFTWHVSSSEQPADLAPAEAGWEAEDLPDGFRLSATEEESASASGEHLVYSDGLASVSVFIEALGSGPPPTQGTAEFGGSTAFSTTVGGYQVTVFGEVPEPTARRIGGSIRKLTQDPKQ